MSATFVYEVLTDKSKPHFARGTSSDDIALQEVFPGGVVTTKDLDTLRAMHAALRAHDSLWKDIADKLEALQGDDYDHEVQIKVSVEY